VFVVFLQREPKNTKFISQTLEASFCKLDCFIILYSFSGALKWSSLLKDSVN